MQGPPLLSLLQELRESGRIAPLSATADSAYSELSDRSLVRKLNQAQQHVAQTMLTVLPPAVMERHPLFQYREWAGTVRSDGILHLPSDVGQVLIVASTARGQQLRRKSATRSRTGDYEVRGLSALYMPGYASRTVYVTYISNLYGMLIGGLVGAGSTTTSLVASSTLSYNGSWVDEDDIYNGLHVALYSSATPDALSIPASVSLVSDFDSSTKTFTLDSALGSAPTEGYFWCTCCALPPIGTELVVYEAMSRVPQARGVYEAYVNHHRDLRKSLMFQVANSGAYQ